MALQARPVVTLRALLIAVVALLVVAPAALATPSINTSVGPDPVESVTTQLGLTGNSDENDGYIQLNVKPTGGTDCGANPDADNGSEVLEDYVDAGAINESNNYTFQNAGSYLLCGWLEDNGPNGRQVVAHISTTISVRRPKLSLSIAAPASVQPNTTFQVTTTAQAEASRDVYVRVVPDTGRGCPANASAAADSDVTTIEDGWNVTGGPLNDTQNVSISDLGKYLACGYFQYNTTDSPPEATAVAPLEVATPQTSSVPSGPTRACRSARSQVRHWSKLITKTKRQLAHAHGRHRSKLRKKLAAEKRTLKRAKDRRTIHC